MDDWLESGPSSSPSTAIPRIDHVEPVSSSRIGASSPPSRANDSRRPSRSGRKTPVAPISLLSSIFGPLSADAVPGVQNTTSSSPPTVILAAPTVRISEYGTATASVPSPTVTTRSFGDSRPSGDSSNMNGFWSMVS
jgi:hypothetical protein